MTEAISMINGSNNKFKINTLEFKNNLKKSSNQIKTAFKDTILYSPKWILAGTVGWFVGVMPGVGGVLANMLGYLVVKETTKNNIKFGKGDVRGLIASEAANNGSVGGALVPALALGIPGSLNTAILLGVFMINGIQPGTNVFSDNLDVTWIILISVSLATLLSSSIIIFGGWRLVTFISQLNPKF